jgi:hypothetical protein
MQIDCIVYSFEAIFSNEIRCTVWAINRYHEVNNLPIPTIHDWDTVTQNLNDITREEVDQNIALFKDKNVIFIDVYLSFKYIFKLADHVKSMWFIHGTIDVYTASWAYSTEDYVRVKELLKKCGNDDEVEKLHNLSETHVANMWNNVKYTKQKWSDAEHPGDKNTQVAWRHFFGDKQEPWFFTIITEYAYMTGIECIGFMTLEGFDKMYLMTNDEIDTFKESTMEAQKLYRKWNSKSGSASYECRYKGYRIKFYNHDNYIRGWEDYGPGKKPMYLPFKDGTFPDFTVGWSHNMKDNTFNLIVESDKKVDVSVFCNQFEHIGHKYTMYCTTPKNFVLGDLFEYDVEPVKPSEE